MITFGLTNAAATFMCLMNVFFNKYLYQFVLISIDDILIYSKTEEEHEQHMRMVLQTLRDHQLYAKMEKCYFFKKEIQYLGHIISEEGITMDPPKIKAMYKWPVMKDLSDI